jgi:hypothetical protein
MDARSMSGDANSDLKIVSMAREAETGVSNLCYCNADIGTWAGDWWTKLLSYVHYVAPLSSGPPAIPSKHWSIKRALAMSKAPIL